MSVIDERGDWFDDFEDAREIEREERMELNWFRFLCFVILAWTAFLMWAVYRFVEWCL